jgi:hypothetical protein
VVVVAFVVWLKITVGHAGNDILELAIGIVLNIIGGTLIGLSANTLWLIISGIILLAIGKVFETRVLAKHHHELRKLSKDLEKATTQNAETLKKMEKQQRVIDSATNKLNEATNEIDRAKNEIEVIQKKSFSRSGSLAVSRSLEDDTQSLHNRLQKVEEKLGFSFFSQRKYGRNFTNRRSSSAVHKSDGLYMDFSFLFNWGIFFYNHWFLPFFCLLLRII